MATAKRTGLGLMAIGLAGAAMAGFNFMAGADGRPIQPASVGKRYTLAIAGGDDLDLVRRKKGEAARLVASGNRTLVCRHVVHVAGLEIGARCRTAPTELAGARTQ